eukprot:2925774-Pyramimonas_sp.AAC.1
MPRSHLQFGAGLLDGPLVQVFAVEHRRQSVLYSNCGGRPAAPSEQSIRPRCAHKWVCRLVVQLWVENERDAWERRGNAAGFRMPRRAR